MFQSKMFNYKLKSYHDEERREGALGLKITSIQEEKLEDFCHQEAANLKLNSCKAGEKRDSFTASITSILEESEEELDSQEEASDNASLLMASIAEDEREMDEAEECSNSPSLLSKLESRRKYGTILPGIVQTSCYGEICSPYDDSVQNMQVTFLLFKSRYVLHVYLFF